MDVTMTEDNINISDSYSQKEASLTDRIAEFAARIHTYQLPNSVINKVKLHLLDALGCGVSGASMAISDSARNVSNIIGEGGECSVFGTELLYSPVAAAFANSNITNALDFDDGTELNGKGLGHPGATLVPVALSGVTRFKVSGKQLIHALAAGYEVNNRLIIALQPSPARFEEVYGVSQHQSVAAAIVYGSLAKLTTQQMHNAIGLAATLTCVPSLHKYNWNERPIVSFKDFVAPAAMSGVLAVELTLANFVGSHNVLDGDKGYWRMLGSDQFDANYLVSELGENWAIHLGSFKQYPACRWLSPALEAHELILKNKNIGINDISKVEVQTFSKVVEDLNEVSPVNEIDAQFSLPFLMAAQAYGIQPGPEWFSQSTLNNDEIKQFAKKVYLQVDPDMDSAMRGIQRRPSASVIIHLHNGTQLKEHVSEPAGGSIRPLIDEAVILKAKKNFSLGGVEADNVINYINNLYDHCEMVESLKLMGR